VEHLAASEILGAKRLRLLSGRPGVNQVDPGSIVCAFFSVGLNHIAAAVEASAMTVEGNGAALRAGTNCGSCRIEIRRIINAAADEKQPSEVSEQSNKLLFAAVVASESV
jgi:assimilatory nitrate reductase catalytic subunit